MAAKCVQRRNRVKHVRHTGWVNLLRHTGWVSLLRHTGWVNLLRFGFERITKRNSSLRKLIQSERKPKQSNFAPKQTKRSFGILLFRTPLLFVLSKARGCAQVAWFWHKRSQRKSKITQSYVPMGYYNRSAPVSIIEVNNIKSVGFVCFTQLQCQWL